MDSAYSKVLEGSSRKRLRGVFPGAAWSMEGDETPPNNGGQMSTSDTSAPKREPTAQRLLDIANHQRFWCHCDNPDCEQMIVDLRRAAACLDEIEDLRRLRDVVAAWKCPFHADPQSPKTCACCYQIEAALRGEPKEGM